jgi:hypothetical protein
MAITPKNNRHLYCNAMRVMRMNTPTELDPSTGLDDVPAALPTGAELTVAVTIPPF